jgi:hypothetical protein
VNRRLPSPPRDCGPIALDSSPGRFNASQYDEQAIEAERDALQRLGWLKGPGQRRAALLALVAAPGNVREQAAWRETTSDLPDAQRVHADVGRLTRAARMPVYEALLGRMRGAPLQERQTLVRGARTVMRADGQVGPLDLLRWLLMRHRLGESARVVATSREHDPGRLSLAHLLAVVRLTAFLARVVPEADREAVIGVEGRLWFELALHPWRAPLHDLGGLSALCRAPDVDALLASLHDVQGLSWMLRPVLVRAWADAAASVHSHAPLNDDATDALRCIAALLDSPLPPLLSRRYRETGWD